MADGTRVTHAVTLAGQSTVKLTTSWRYIRVVNWGTVPLQVKAQFGPANAPTMVWNDPDQDIVPVGESALVIVAGAPFDQGVGGQDPGVSAYVLPNPTTAGSAFSVCGANG